MLLQHIKKRFWKWIDSLVSIPQAVGAVATSPIDTPDMVENFKMVSIPQAVGAVAT